MSRTKKLTLCAVLTAIVVLILLLSSAALPVRLALAALAGLIPAVAVIHCGTGWALGTYAATTILALLLLPEKTGAVWYALFFGHYPVIKSLIERIKRLPLIWLCKVGVFAGCTAALFFLLQSFFFAALPDRAIWILLPALLVAFVFYDIAFSALISFYIRRIAPHIDRKGH